MKTFNIGLGFMTDKRIEPLFRKVNPLTRVRTEGVNIYTGTSKMFDSINGNFIRICYKDGEFKAFDPAEVEDGWLFLDQPDRTFDDVLKPELKVEKTTIKLEAEKYQKFVIPKSGKQQAIDEAPGQDPEDVINVDDQELPEGMVLRGATPSELATQQFNMIESGVIGFNEIEDRMTFINNLEYTQLYDLANSLGFDYRSYGGKRKDQVLRWLQLWKAEEANKD